MFIKTKDYEKMIEVQEKLVRHIEVLEYRLNIVERQLEENKDLNKREYLK